MKRKNNESGLLNSLNRRDLIALVGGAIVLGSRAALAQQDDRVRRIGVLTQLSADDPRLH